jgi:hypothetical protein
MPDVPTPRATPILTSTAIQLDDILPPAIESGPLDEQNLAGLVDGIGACGLLHPPTVDLIGRLIAGRHRLAAVRRLCDQDRANFDRHFPSSQIGVPFLANVSAAAYDKPGAFERLPFRLSGEYSHNYDRYRRDVELSLRKAIYKVIDEHSEDGPVGLCIRAFNDNAKTRQLVENLKLDKKRIEVLPYYGQETSGVSVKRAIAQREHPELPYLILVTNRARMADAFPKEVRFFMDLAQRASDLNSLLQGLLGRACGYGKQRRDAEPATRGNARV